MTPTMRIHCLLPCPPRLAEMGHRHAHNVLLPMLEFFIFGTCRVV